VVIKIAKVVLLRLFGEKCPSEICGPNWHAAAFLVCTRRWARGNTGGPVLKPSGIEQPVSAVGP